ncbi:hypothetical protein F4009_16700 [Candidatus Poribacteria bacterium]|nr:hypothetical protein [Candidatus Poribacteria bacterium]
MPGNRKGVGLLSVFCLACLLWCVLSLVLLSSVLGIRSTQPTGRYGFFLKSTLMVRFDEDYSEAHK